ncbi:MAG: hypothetical protein SO314_07505 [Alphaproteobacteria bacterium]|nr:hypothetical protein [Alphaproteobacteria bacterium]
MNYRTILLASAAVMFATAASAKDITNPFYLPEQGKVLSDTSIETSRTNLKHGIGNVDKSLYANEEITYGISDNLSVFGSIGNYFDGKKFSDGQYNNDHNFDYTVGAKYNMQAGNWLAQVGASYYTYNPKSWYGHKNYEGNDRWQKELAAQVKLGYDLCNGWTPYTSFDISGNIDDADRELDYAWFGGVHKKFDKASVDAGLRYDFTTDGKNANQLYAQAEANYFVKENIALGVYGDYYLGGNSDYDEDIDYDYTAGLQAKVLF